MNREILERMNAINNKQIPSGYRFTKNIGIAPKEWYLGKLSDVVTSEKRLVSKPDKPYWRLGIKSWAKGTFHTLVDEPETVNMDELYEVCENDLVVNITFAWEHAIAIAKADDDGMLVSHRFPTYKFKEGQIPRYFEEVIKQRFFKDMLEHISPGGAGRNRVLNQKDFLNLPCYIPPQNEQEKIAEILSKYDEIIELYEYKKSNLITLKRNMLKKMFPTEGRDVPEIRFPEFSDAWEQREFNSVFSMLQNNTLSRAELVTDNGVAMNVHYGDILVKFGEVLDLEIETLPYIESEQVVAKFKSSYLQNGDIIVADTAEDEAVGKCTEIANLGDATVISGLHTIPLRPQQKFASGYFGYYLNSNSYHDTLIPLMQGTKVTSISKSALQRTNVRYPAEYREQEQISSYFRNLDNLITLHQHMIDEQKRLKAGLSKLLLTGLVRVE